MRLRGQVLRPSWSSLRLARAARFLLWQSPLTTGPAAILLQRTLDVAQCSPWRPTTRLESFYNETMVLLPLIAMLSFPGPASEVRVNDSEGLRRAAATAKPGTRILLESGSYVGGIQIGNLHGTKSQYIQIAAADPNN